MITALALCGLAAATPSYDPSSPEAVFTGVEAHTADGSVRIWSAVERHRDADPLFVDEAFNSSTEWADNPEWAPHIRAAFGRARPDSGSFLLHVGLEEESASGTPVLLVPGAGDNGSRAFVTLAAHLAEAGKPVYALTFAHPQGDTLLQAEIVADAISTIRARTGSQQVDLVGHSKGGLAAAAYVSNASGTAWDHPYDQRGTAYRGDVRRLVLLCTPLDGLDTLYRWPALNYASLDASTASSPTSWQDHYPSGSTAWWVEVDLADQDLLPDGADLFPGQRQLLRRQSPPLPGTLPWLGAYALQPDWYTTYEGGWGTWSWTEGIDAAEEAGGFFLDHLEEAGVDPEVELFLLAGDWPLMPTGAGMYWSELLSEGWVDLASAGTDTWATLVAAAWGDSLGVSEEELQGLASGDLVMGELTGESDGLVFVQSALYAEALTGRGARVVEARTVELSHLDVLYASPVTGELLQEEAAADPLREGWKEAWGQRYAQADTLGWIDEVLADEAPEDTDTGWVPEEDTGDPSGGSGLPERRGCGCASGGLATGWLWLLVLGVLASGRVEKV